MSCLNRNYQIYNNFLKYFLRISVRNFRKKISQRTSRLNEYKSNIYFFVKLLLLKQCDASIVPIIFSSKRSSFLCLLFSQSKENERKEDVTPGNTDKYNRKVV